MKLNLTLLIALAAVLGPTSAKADTYAYAATGDDYFGVVDLTTGVFDPLGNMGSASWGLALVPEEYCTERHIRASAMAHTAAQCFTA
jgi:hypothetical protein